MFNKKLLNRLIYSELHLFFATEGEKQVRKWFEENRCLKTEKLYDKLPNLQGELSKLKNKFEEAILDDNSKNIKKITELKNQLELKEKQVLMVTEKLQKYKIDIGSLAVLYILIEKFNKYELIDISKLYYWYSTYCKEILPKTSDTRRFYVSFYLHKIFHKETLKILFSEYDPITNFHDDYYYDEYYSIGSSDFVNKNICTSKILKDYVNSNLTITL